jgi:hypothetical protein
MRAIDHDDPVYSREQMEKPRGPRPTDQEVDALLDVLRKQYAYQKIDLYRRAGLKPGELLTCELCGQQPESIAFDVDECRDECPFRSGARDDGAITES